MSRLIGAFALVLLAVLLLLSLRAWEALPMSRQPLIEEKYAGWSGVLRVWVCLEWATGRGSPAAWLNACAAGFEKAHPGVYIQPQAVDAGAIRTLGESGVNPPDMLLFSPGLLERPEHLAPLVPEAALRPPLVACGVAGGATYAVPVAMGGYAWAYDRSKLPALPDSWAEAEVIPAIPADEPGRCWSAAALALCSGLSLGEAARPAPPGLDLGLPEALPAPSPEVGSAEGVPCRLPADVPRPSDAYAAFASGEVIATAVGPEELARLGRLADSGRGPDWALGTTGRYALADQLALMAVVDWPRSDLGERQELCRAFLEHLLSEGSQKALERYGALPVAAGIAAQEGRSALALLERGLAEKELLAAPAFGRGWRVQAEAALARFLSGELDARRALAEIPGLIREKPEHSVR